MPHTSVSIACGLLLWIFSEPAVAAGSGSNIQRKIGLNTHYQSQFTVEDAESICNGGWIDYIGEFRNWKDKSQCLDVAGTAGEGDVEDTHVCDARLDQIWYYCHADASIRNALGYCLTVKNDGLGDSLESAPCVEHNHDETTPDAVYNAQYMWKIINVKQDMDDGVTFTKQTIFQIQHLATGDCIDVDGDDGNGDIGLWKCQTWGDRSQDQWWFVPNFGDVFYDDAWFQNALSGECLDVEGTDGKGDVGTWTCKEKDDQRFVMYQNGWVVNVQSGWCLDIAGSDGTGDVKVLPCYYTKDQTFDIESMTYDSDASPLSSYRDDNYCLAAVGADGDGDIQTYECTDSIDQKWFIRYRWRDIE